MKRRVLITVVAAVVLLILQSGGSVQPARAAGEFWFPPPAAPSHSCTVPSGNVWLTTIGGLTVSTSYQLEVLVFGPGTPYMDVTLPSGPAKTTGGTLKVIVSNKIIPPGSPVAPFPMADPTPMVLNIYNATKSSLLWSTFCFYSCSSGVFTCGT